MRSPGALWSLVIALMMVLLVHFLDMVRFQVYGGELVLFQGVVMKFKDKIMLQGCRQRCCEYGNATEILYCVQDVLGESYVTRLFHLMNSKADSRYSNP